MNFALIIQRFWMFLKEGIYSSGLVHFLRWDWSEQIELRLDISNLKLECVCSANQSVPSTLYIFWGISLQTVWANIRTSFFRVKIALNDVLLSKSMQWNLRFHSAHRYIFIIYIIYGLLLMIPFNCCTLFCRLGCWLRMLLKLFTLVGEWKNFSTKGPYLCVFHFN